MKPLIIFLGIVLGICAPAYAFAQSNLGMVGIKSVYGRYLQAHTDGEMHASNEHRNEEETWFLIEVDKPNHIYALLNWRNGKFMSKRTNGCAPAVSTTLAPSEQWVLVSGRTFGVVNAVAFRNVADGTYLGANAPGADTPNCGGEVASGRADPPPQNNGAWPGWWVMEGATTPAPGKDFWNTVGGTFQGIVNNINIADVAAVLAAIL